MVNCGKATPDTYILNIELFINREDKIIETKYYVKPSNSRLYLNYRSCHPPHTFKSIVYSQALQGIMVNSRPEWNIEYLKELRNKFLDQGYPISMINCEFRRALEVDRKDLIFSTNKQKKRIVIAPLIVTFWPSSILVVFHFGRLPFWSSSILVVFHFGRLPF